MDKNDQVSIITMQLPFMGVGQKELGLSKR